MDVVGDFLTVLRNASSAKKASCTVQWSKLREGIAVILKNIGYIKDFSKSQVDDGARTFLTISLKYVNGVSAITEIGRIGKPGCRRYTSKAEIPSILGGMGDCILSTSKGVMSGKDAKRSGVGGELMCYIW